MEVNAPEPPAMLLLDLVTDLLEDARRAQHETEAFAGLGGASLTQRHHHLTWEVRGTRLATAREWLRDALDQLERELDRRRAT